MFPFKAPPYHKDFEDCLNFWRRHDAQHHETLLIFLQSKFTGIYHPGREDADDYIIQDAEFSANVQKQLDEARHDMAIKCVQLGIYKNIVEAQTKSREVGLQTSKYKYKDLLYRS